MLTKKNTFLLSETLRFVILASLVTYAYWPFIFNLGLNLGGSDARFYQYILHDAIIQLNHGIFPTYAGQSEFSFFGGPVIRAPYYLLLGQLIYIISFKSLNALAIQHLTILFSAYAAAFLTYYLLLNLAPKLRWISLALAFFYVSCPGVIGLIYRYDMYYSFMTLPYVSLTIYGLIRLSRKNDAISSLLIALGLSLIWMSHPPIALWTTAVVFIFYFLQFISIRKGLRSFLIVFSLLLALNLWQFVSIFSMGIEQGYGAGRLSLHSLFSIFQANDGIANNMTQELRNAFPGILLPLQWSTNSFLPFLQLGYSLWLVMFLGLYASFRSKNNFSNRALLFCALLLMLFLYPLPFIGHALWAHLPSIVITITDSCPMQRFYIILSVLICFIGISALNKICSTSNKVHQIILLIMTLLISWNTYQVSYFFSALTGKNNFWIDSKNIYFTAGQVASPLYIGLYDPKLKNQLLNGDKIPLVNYDNEQFLMTKCFANQSKYFNMATQASLNMSMYPPLFTLKSSPDQQYLVCLNLESQSQVSVMLRSNGEHFVGLGDSNVKFIPLPLFIHNPTDKDLSVAFDNIQSAAPIKLIKAGIINYTSTDLPIQIDSFTPYKAHVTTPNDNTYLKILKKFFPGYTAKVNGQITPVFASDSDQTILIPLKQKGVNQIELIFSGSILMKITFYISAIAGCLVLNFLLILWWRNRKSLLREV